MGLPPEQVAKFSKQGLAGPGLLALDEEALTGPAYSFDAKTAAEIMQKIRAATAALDGGNFGYSYKYST